MFDSSQKFFLSLKSGLLKCHPEPTWSPHAFRCLVLTNQFRRMFGILASENSCRVISQMPGKEARRTNCISTRTNEEGNTDEAQVIFSRFPWGQGSPPPACRPYQLLGRAAFRPSVTSAAWFNSCTVSSDDLSPEGRTRMSLEVTDKV